MIRNNQSKKGVKMVSNQQIYTEVYGILDFLGEDYINKLPHELYKLVLDNKFKEKSITYKEINEIIEKNTSREAISIIALFHQNYWSTQTEKDDINKLLKKNYILKQSKIKEKYNPDNLFKNRRKNEESQENAALIEYKKENFFEKLLNGIIKFLKRK